MVIYTIRIQIVLEVGHLAIHQLAVAIAAVNGGNGAVIGIDLGQYRTVAVPVRVLKRWLCGICLITLTIFPARL